MITVHCKCKKSTMSFRYLKTEDLPEGFTAPCCKDIAEMAILQGFGPEEDEPTEDSPKKGRGKKK